MLDNIIHFSIKNKLIVGLFTLGLLVLGLYSATQLPIDAVPDITNNQVQVITQSPSLAAQEVERLITFPVEQTMATIPEISEIRSISRFGLSVVTIVFHDDVDIYWARQQVSERLSEAMRTIPQGVGSPELAPVTTGLGEIYQYVLHPKAGYEDKYTAMELRSIQDWIVRRQLLGTVGVADVSSFGGVLKQYEIALNTDKLRSYNLSIQDIFKALEINNQNTGGAYIDKKPNAYFIRSEGLIGNLSDIEKIQIANTANGLPILVRDVATVQFGHANRYGAMTRNGKGEVVGALVLMLKGANSNKVIANVKERMAQIEKTLPEGVMIEPFLDRSNLVGRAIGTVSKNLIEGALIVIFVLVLFLGNLRGGLIVASMIPLCMLFAVSLMNLFGVSGNLMSLGAIDFGLIVDGAVIIVEATMHHLGLSKANRLTQEQMDEEVYQSASQIRSSAAFGEIIILIVYLPILALAGVEGKMFRPMAQTVAFAILGAFILSLTYVPMMSTLFLSKNVAHKRNFSDRMMDFFHRIYDPVIRFTLRRKLLVVASSLVLLGVSIFMFTRMGGEFIPNLEEGDFAVETRVLTGSSLSHTVEASTKAEKILLEKFPEVKQVVCKIGAGEIPTDPMPIEACDMMIILKDKDEWTSASTREELVSKMSEELEAIPGVSFGFQQPIQMRFNELMTGARQDVAIKIFGEDLDVLTSLSKKIAAIAPTIQGAQDLYVEQVTGLPQIIAKIDREKLYQFNVSIEDINQAIRASFAGESAGLVYEGEKRFDLVVRLEKSSRQDVADVSNLYVTNAQGKQIPLSQLAEVSLAPGPNQIQREDAKRRLTIGFNVRGRDVESIVKEIQQRIEAEVKFPPGYYVTYGGQFENLIEAKQRLSIAVPVALILIFVLLYFTFTSFRQSILIFSAIPLSAIGGVFALWLRDMPFSISAGIGFIALFGVAVLNGIVLIGEFNRLKKEGLTDLHEIVLKGTGIRLRPVLMTATVASLGFLPMALSHGSGAEVQKPLATVVIGGLLSATLLTLMVLPVLYTWFEKGAKVNKGLTAMSLILFAFMFGQNQAKAQAPRAITLQEAMTTAIQNNSGLKAASYNVEYNKTLKGTASDIGKTNATLMYGQYNSYYRDNNITVSQTIPFPTSMHRQAQYYNATTKSAEYSKRATENELLFNVKTAYYSLQYAKAKLEVLSKQDSIFVTFLKSAELRLRTGESNALEKATAESQLYEVRTLKAQNDADILIFQNQLKTLLNTQEEVSSEGMVLDKKVLAITSDSATIANNPALQYFQQQVKVAEAGKSVEKARLMPDLTLGYFNQSLYGTPNYRDPSVIANGSNRFQGVMLGVSFPLWAKPQLARIKANEANKNAAQASFELYQKNLQGQYAQAFQEYQKFKNSLDYYEKNALPTADVITKNALKNYQSGNIGYIEFSQGLSRALSIQTNYLAILSQYNQSIVNIEFIIGQ